MKSFYQNLKTLRLKYATPMKSLDHSLSCLICPYQRYHKEKNHKATTSGGEIYHIINNPYCNSDDEEIENEMIYFQSLVPHNKDEGEQDNLSCWACRKKIIGKTYYFCSHCQEIYHKECVVSPSVFQSSDHPKHPLQLLFFPSLDSDLEKWCWSCGDKCGNFFYHCSICDFMIHPICARTPTPLTIENQRRHEHTLHYFPRKSSLVCDVCGLEGGTDYLYVCVTCDFIVHKRCVCLPYVIKTSRHDHRLTFSPHIPYKEWPDCGVCHGKINGDYGKYSCKKGCAYAMHSRCAMQKDVSDGKELEGEPEEIYENIKMYEEEGDGIIRHLSHRHHLMQLEKKIQRVYGETKYCQACRLPFDDDGSSYQCMQCDFTLHESCAYLPRVKQFMLHVHPLILEPDSTTNLRFHCRKCSRYTCGFRYVCRLQGCDLELDTLCASVCEPFDYHSHPHPLFITSGEESFGRCSICPFGKQQLNCIKCDFSVCFHCATLPHKVKFEHDEHLLTFFYEKNANGKFYWCDICEEDINPENGLYACNECKVTLHIECLLGRDPYMKPGQRLTYFQETVSILSNNHSTRPICKTCKRRCLYKMKIESSDKSLFYSIDCRERYFEY